MKRLLKTDPSILFYFFFWFGYFSWFWFNLFQFNEQGDLTVGQANIWADWALHFTLGNTMAIRELIPTASTLLLDATFSYPLGIDLISALLMKSGMNMLPAFILPSYLFSLLLVFSLYLFFYRLFHQPVIAVIASFIFFFNGGVGFYYFFQEGLSSSDFINTLINPVSEVTNIKREQIYWMSVLNSMFLPQRSLTMGFPLTLLALSQIIGRFNLTADSGKSICFYPILPAVIILGLMPVIHTHSFLSAAIILSCWMLADLIKVDSAERFVRLKIWLELAAVVSLIALPLLAIFFSSQISSNHFSWNPGWMAGDASINWLLFWFKNWTVVPLLAVSGWLLIIVKQPTTKRVSFFLLYLPFFLLFALANLFQLHPWIWDNTKLLVWASAGFSGLTAYAIHYFIKIRSGRVITLAKTVVAGLLVLAIILSGVIDSYRNIRMDLHRFTLYTQAELNLAQWAKENTASDSIWLVSPRHNHWLFNLTGRQAVITYGGWLWSHGIDYQTTEQDIKLIFKTANNDLLKKHRIDYVVIDQHSIQQLKANTALFTLKYKIIKQDGKNKIFKIH